MPSVYFIDVSPSVPTQQDLPEVADSDCRARESHGNRGKLFEGMLEKTHHLYRVKGVADVDYIENAFVFCSEAVYRRLPPQKKARMGDGRTLKRVQTPGDYRGTLGKFGIAFDAKECGDDRFSLTKLPRHQVESLYSFARAGGLAGFLIWMKRVGVYWVDAQTMSDLYYAALFNRGVKTLNLKWFAEQALFVGRVIPGGLVEYAESLTPHKQILKAA